MATFDRLVIGMGVVFVLGALITVWRVHSQELEFGLFDLAGKGRPFDPVQSNLPPLCMDYETSERLRGIMYAALDSSVKDQAESVFKNWVRDPTDQPTRAAQGMRRTFEAYLRARQAVRDWAPKPCEGGQ